MQVNIGLSEEHTTNITEALERLLADEYVLLVKTRNFHWNVKGIQFASLHALFEEQYNTLNNFADDIAERILALGKNAPGSMQAFLSKTSLKESVHEGLSAQDMLQLLLNDHESIIRQMRQMIVKIESWGDAGTADFVTGIMEAHEKMAWMLRASLS